MTSNFIPGKEIHTFKTKSGKEALIRYPQWSDLPALTEYINTLSQEDTFITVFNKEVTYEEETDYLSKLFKEMELNKEVTLLCFVDKELVAVSGFKQKNYNGSRDDHVAEFGISVKNEFRNAGIGFMMARTVIKEGLSKVSGIKIIRLNVFGGNEQAIHLYEKLGFEEAGRIPGGILFRDNYIDNIFMYLEANKFSHNSSD
jgi:RimJ/RimL family protein N-acetyltransferase